MTRFALRSVVFLTALACYGEKRDAADTPAAAAATVSMGDFAGTWTGQAMPVDRDTVIVSYTFMGTADTSGWMMHLPNRPPIAMRVTPVAGDSIIVEAGPYESVLRRGVTTSTRTVWHFRDGQLVGRTEATYRYPGGVDSVVVLRQTATRAP